MYSILPWRRTTLIDRIDTAETERLQPETWLSDVLIHNAIKILINNSPAEGTVFKVRSSHWITRCLVNNGADPSKAPNWYTRKQKHRLDKNTILLIPFNQCGHWTLFVVLLGPNVVFHLDSSRGCIPRRRVEQAFSVIVDLMCGEGWGAADDWFLYN